MRTGRALLWEAPRRPQRPRRPCEAAGTGTHHLPQPTGPRQRWPSCETPPPSRLTALRRRPGQRSACDSTRPPGARRSVGQRTRHVDRDIGVLPQANQSSTQKPDPGAYHSAHIRNRVPGAMRFMPAHARCAAAGTVDPDDEPEDATNCGRRHEEWSIAFLSMCLLNAWSANKAVAPHMPRLSAR